MKTCAHVYFLRLRMLTSTKKYAVLLNPTENPMLLKTCAFYRRPAHCRRFADADQFKPKCRTQHAPGQCKQLSFIDGYLL